MCGRFTLSVGGDELADAFDLAEPPPQMARRYNIAPTDQVLAIRRDDQGRRLAVPMRWGLIPPRSRELPRGRPVINARSETVERNGMFRAAFRRRRCVVPADGFYEWRKLAEGRFPFRFSRADGRPFAMAGLYGEWTAPDGQVVASTTVLTTEPNRVVAELHNRMPVILRPEDVGIWLDLEGVMGSEGATPEALHALLRPAPDDLLVGVPVSRRVNSVRNDDAECLAPAEHPPGPDADGAQLALLD